MLSVLLSLWLRYLRSTLDMVFGSFELSLLEMYVLEFYMHALNGFWGRLQKGDLQFV